MIFFCLQQVAVTSFVCSQKIENGLVFTPHMKLYMGGVDYVVPYKINFFSLKEPIRRAARQVSDLMWAVNRLIVSKEMKDLLKHHVQVFQQGIQEVNESLNSFLIGCCQMRTTKGRRGGRNRNKRGAINFVGDIAGKLFGLATQKQIKAIHSQLDSLHTLTDTERRLLNVHTKVLNNTVRNQEKMNSALYRLGKAVNNTATVINGLTIKALELEGGVLLNQVISEMTMSLTDMKSDIIELRLGITSMLSTRLDSRIIPNKILIKVIGEASLSQPGVLFPAREEYMAAYTALIRVIPMFTDGEHMTFYLLIPLRGTPAEAFDIYSVSPLPMPLPLSKEYYFSYDHDGTYFVVSKSRQFHFNMKDLQVCRKFREILLCPVDAAIYSRHSMSCEFAVFLGLESAKDLCTKSVFRNHPPVFIPTEGGWAYSTPHPIEFTITCTHETQTIRRRVEGVGLMILGRGCSAHSEFLMLPGHITVNSTRQLEFTALPLLSNLSFTQIEWKGLEKLTTLSHPTIDPLSHVKMPLRDLLDKMQTIPKPPPPPPGHESSWSTWTWRVGALMVTMGVLVITLCIARTWVSSRLAWVSSRMAAAVLPPIFNPGWGQERRAPDDQDPPEAAQGSPICPRGRGQLKEGACRNSEQVQQGPSSQLVLTDTRQSGVVMTEAYTQTCSGVMQYRRKKSTLCFEDNDSDITVQFDAPLHKRMMAIEKWVEQTRLLRLK